jgi:hypothetical protein
MVILKRKASFYLARLFAAEFNTNPKRKRAMCAAPNLGQVNESAQSNQQDLIDQIEANRQWKSARGEEVLLGTHAN